MTDIREILRRLQLGEPDRRIARDLNVSRNTVREFMVTIKRGADPDRVWVHLGVPWQERHIEAALQDARALIGTGVSPF